MEWVGMGLWGGTVWGGSWVKGGNTANPTKLTEFTIIQINTNFTFQPIFIISS